MTCVRLPAVDTDNEFFWAQCHWVYLFIEVNALVTVIMIRCKFFFLFIDREPTTWPANNSLQIMVCSCVMSSNCAWLQIMASNSWQSPYRLPDMLSLIPCIPLYILCVPMFTLVILYTLYTPIYPVYCTYILGSLYGDCHELLAQIIFCPCVNETTLFSFLRSLLRENGSFPKIFIKKQTRWLNYKTIMISHAWHNFPFPCSWNQIQGLHRTALSLCRFQKCKRSHSLCGFPEFKPSLQAPDCPLSQWSLFTDQQRGR